MSVHTCKYIRGFRINVGFIIYEELSLLNKAVTLIKDLSIIPKSIAQAIEQESPNDEHDSEATQESDLEQEASENCLTEDEGQ